MSGTIGRVIDVLAALAILGLLLRYSKEFSTIVHAGGEESRGLFAVATLQEPVTSRVAHERVIGFTPTMGVA